MWNENEWYYPENDTSLRFRALGGVWSRRPPRFSPYFPTSTDSAPFSSSGATGSPTAQYRLPRIPIGLITPHAGFIFYFFDLLFLDCFKSVEYFSWHSSFTI